MEFSADVKAPTDPEFDAIRVTATGERGATAAASVTVVVPPAPGTGTTPQDSLRAAVTNPPPPSAGDWAAASVKARYLDR